MNDIKEHTYLIGSDIPIQLCPNCGVLLGAIPGGRDATCQNCGFKDPCCE